MDYKYQIDYTSTGFPIDYDSSNPMIGQPYEFPQTFPYPFDWNTAGPKKLVLPLTNEEIEQLRGLLKEKQNVKNS